MIDLEPAASRMAELLAGIADDQLDRPTPCPEYTVADLIDHVDQVCTGFTGIARHDTAEPTTDPRGPGWRDRIDGRLRDLGAAWRDPAAWQGSSAVPGLELANDVWGRIALTELVVHGWDLAVATGQSFNLPEPTLHACLAHVTEFLPNAPIPALWGPAAEVTEDASLLDRIVAGTGRQPVSLRH